ncbi:MAG: DNA repair protein RadC [Lachnospiraceae bacterium]|nr:DNA repair protein RadC [Lachnospiraceae bacterium]
MGENIITMKELPVSERPYEKCAEFGPSVLSDAELLAVIIRTGSGGMCSTELARQVLMRVPEKTIGGLFQMSQEQLQEIRGIGMVKSVQLQCLTEITRRMMRSCMDVSALICDDPERVAAAYMSMRFLETEQVRLLILDGKNAVKRDIELSSGTFNASMAAPREVYYNALKYKAVSILLLHNHPSGDPTPSRDDHVATRRIMETGRLIGIPLIDHIVIGDNRYVSFREGGYLKYPDSEV